MKVNNQKKIRKKKSYANMTQNYKMMINDNKEDIKQESYHPPKLVSDTGALAMKCGRNEEPDQVQQLIEKSL
jgi:hypothetical protein